MCFSRFVCVDVILESWVHLLPAFEITIEQNVLDDLFNLTS